MSNVENLAVMFTDIVGFTELTSAQSRDQNEAMLLQSEKLLVGVAKKFGGTHIKSIGDALLLVFRSPTDSVRCAMAMHDALWEYNQEVSKEEQITIRVAINSGEVRLTGGDVFGEPVNVAARLEALTPANEVYFTEGIYLSMNKAEVLHELVGKQKLKGIPDEVTIYRVPRGATAQRLVTANNDEADENQYPYGGMHRSDDTNAPSLSAKPIAKRLAALALVIAVVTGAVLFWPKPLLELSEYQQLLDANKLPELDTKIAKVLASNPNDAVANFMAGHLNTDRRNYAEALENYRLAINSNAALANDPRYAKNIVSMMSANGTEVTELVELSPSDEVVSILSERSLAAGSSGRRDAVYILNKIGRRDKVDEVAVALLDLSEAKDCDTKVQVIKLLQSYKDARALPALKELTKGGFLKRNCGARAAKKAISAIHKELRN